MTLPLATKDNRSNLFRAFKASGCRVCGKRYPELDWGDLHIDHVDPRDKNRDRISGVPDLRSGSIQRFSNSSAARILAELLKCQVLCRKCHAEKHRNGNGHSAEQLPLFGGNGSFHYDGR